MIVPKKDNRNICVPYCFIMKVSSSLAFLFISTITAQPLCPSRPPGLDDGGCPTIVGAGFHLCEDTSDCISAGVCNPNDEECCCVLFRQNFSYCGCEFQCDDEGGSFCKGSTTDPSSAPVTALPTVRESDVPTFAPTVAPSEAPTTKSPTQAPSMETKRPSPVPTLTPSASPSVVRPSSAPTDSPTASAIPSPTPSVMPSNTLVPSGHPSIDTSLIPTTTPSSLPTDDTPSDSPSPSILPSQFPSGTPSQGPSRLPTEFEPTESQKPSPSPSMIPISEASLPPTIVPTSTASMIPSSVPTHVASGAPSTFPTTIESGVPSQEPSLPPSPEPTTSPTSRPTNMPSPQPTQSLQPTLSPTVPPTISPSAFLTETPLPTSSVQIKYHLLPKMKWTWTKEQRPYLRHIRKGNGVTLSPDNNLVYVTHHMGNLLVLNAQDGSEYWMYSPERLEDDWQIKCTGSVAFGRSATSGEDFMVYALTDTLLFHDDTSSRLVAISHPYNRVLWISKPFPGETVGSPVITQSANTEGEYIFINHNVETSQGVWEGRFSVFSTILNGELLYTYAGDKLPYAPLGVSHFPSRGNFVGGTGNNNDVVVWSTNEGHGTVESGVTRAFQIPQNYEIGDHATNVNDLEVFDLKNVSWSSTARPKLSSDGSNLFFGATRSQVQAWTENSFDKDESWNLELLPNPETELAAVENGPALSVDNERLFSSAASNAFYGLRAHDGTQLWAVNIGTTPTAEAQVTPDDERVYIIESKFGRVRALQQATGGTFYSVDCDTFMTDCTNAVEGEFSISDDGMFLYYGDVDGQIIALELGASVFPAPEATDYPSFSPGQTPESTPVPSPIEETTTFPTLSPTSEPTPSQVVRPTTPPTDSPVPPTLLSTPPPTNSPISTMEPSFSSPSSSPSSSPILELTRAPFNFDSITGGASGAHAKSMFLLSATAILLCFWLQW